MTNTSQIKSGILKYIGKEVAPMITELVDRSIGTLCTHKAAQLFGVVSADGSINMEVVRDLAKTAVPETGIVINLPLGASVTITRADVDTLYTYIMEG